MDPKVSFGNSPAATSDQAPVSNLNPAAGEKKFRYYQIALVNARLEPFDGDFRKAIATINNFTEVIKAGPEVYNASVVTLPLDISSSANLQGNTQVVQNEANFSLSIIVGIGDES